MKAGGSQHPIIAVIGATGTGKSQLAVELACRFNGEVINADAMQMYRGLPVITNKITEAERKDVPHHLIGSIAIDEPTWTVGRFVQRAAETVSGIHQRGKLPVIVGGTHYYTQALLFHDGLVKGEDEGESVNGSDDTPFLSPEERDEQFPILQADTPAILAKLREVDPKMADRWHPNDRRKIQRSLEIFLRSGKTASATYEEQQQARRVRDGPHTESGGETEPGGGLRYPTLLLWIHCEAEALRERLDRRVDTMLESGLLHEVEQLNSSLSDQSQQGNTLDTTRGIFVSIGFKQFQGYQTALASGSLDEPKLEKLKQQAIEATKAATRQYAKRQIRWIRIKLLNALRGYDKSIYLLDGSVVEHWQNRVERPAEEVVRAFLDGQELPEPAAFSEAAAKHLAPSRSDMSQNPDMWQRRACAACNAVFVTPSSWEVHIKSKGHRYAVKRTERVPNQQQSRPGSQEIDEQRL